MADLTVARTILSQLGANRFTLMTGAKGYLGGDNFLSFKLPGGGGYCKDGINYVHITLDPSDTYTVAFSRVRGAKVTNVATLTDIYADSLREVFTRYTGLHTSLI